MLDKSKGLALGAELVTNGGNPFTTTTGFVGNAPGITTVSVVSGNLRVSIDTAYGRAAYTLSGLVVGKTYKFTVNALASLGDWYVNLSGGLVGSTSQGRTARTINIYATATATTANVLLIGIDASPFDISSFSVKQIAGNHAFQATNANRPILSSRVNLLTKTEDFSDGVWLKGGGCTVTGTNILNLPNLNSYVTQANALNIVVGLSITVNITLSGTGTTRQWFNLYGINGNSFVDGPIITLSDTPTVYSYKITSSVVNQNISIYIGRAYLADTTTLTVGKVDLRPTNAGALLPPYQRVNTASDYDSVGFPLYLKCNGSSSAMSTNSIDFTSTNKMTVVTGVRKLSEGLQSILENYTGAINTNTFTLTVSQLSLGYDSYLVGSGTYGGTTVTTFTSPISNVVTDLMDRAKPTLQTAVVIRVNSNIPTRGDGGSSLPTAGNFANLPLYLFARGGAGVWFNGQFYGAIIRGAQSDTASVTQTENYMAQKTGITF
jgi:hypothetical protein